MFAGSGREREAGVRYELSRMQTELGHLAPGAEKRARPVPPRHPIKHVDHRLVRFRRRNLVRHHTGQPPALVVVLRRAFLAAPGSLSLIPAPSPAATLPVSLLSRNAGRFYLKITCARSHTRSDQDKRARRRCGARRIGRVGQQARAVGLRLFARGPAATGHCRRPAYPSLKPVTRQIAVRGLTGSEIPDSFVLDNIVQPGIQFSL
jgi:hypothetical protein